MNKNSKIPALAVLSVLCFALSACAGNNLNEITKTGYALDTIINITAYGYGDLSAYEIAVDSAFDEIERLEGLLSANIEGNDIDKIGKLSGAESVRVSDEVLEVIQSSMYYSELSNGLFDITIAPLAELWNIKSGSGHFPEDNELESARPLVNYKNIKIDGGNVSLKYEGMGINLGAIAKGYIADKVKSSLIESGINSAVLNLGGNVLLIGEKPDGGYFNIGLQNPLSSTGDYFAVLKAKDKSIVSSGPYERNFTYEGKIYHHILNPSTGFPADNNLLQVTIVSDNSVDGDALSTTAYLLGLEDGLKLIESIKGCEAIFVTDENLVYATEGILNSFEITDNAFRLAQ